MVKPVRLNDPLHIGAFGEVALIQSFVDDDIMEADIDRAVSRHTRANDRCPVARRPARSQYDHRRRWDCKDHEIKIVTFPKSCVRAMMIGVKEPARPVHHPAVHDIGKKLHPNDRDQKQGKSGDNEHSPYIESG